MLSRLIRLIQSRCVVAHPAAVESLEGRRFLSQSSIAADVLDLGSAAASQTLSTLSVQPVKIEGTYSGHFVSEHLGKSTLVFTITHDTHTGHFVGTAVINARSVGTLTGTIKGVVKVNKHTDVTFTGDGFTGTFIGTASHTGGSFYGSYAVSGKGVSDTGTYHVGKA